MKIFILVLESLRPKQWTKNLFIFAGLLFSQNIFNPLLLFKVILAFIIFCLLSGSMYLINDLFDLEQDKRHPLRSHRPLASGRLKVTYAILASLILLLSLLLMSYYINQSFFVVAVAYFLLQLGYSCYLKHIVILDVFTIACGFVLRVVAGAVAINVEISTWLLICSILLALFLGLCKRRHELVLLKGDAQNYRKVLAKYSPYLLDQMISVVTASTVVAYVLYTMSDETVRKFDTKNLVFTTPFVIYGIFRYLYLIDQKEAGANPENTIVTDSELLIDVLLWILVIVILLYW